MQRVYLVSRVGDIFLGLATGVLAYGLYERKNHRAEEDKLASLVKWKWAQREVKQVEQEGWKELEDELKLKQDDASVLKRD
ncbi:hypothetical protein JCM8097_007917 [Rhodosporidiobolus ruineniae]